MRPSSLKGCFDLKEALTIKTGNTVTMERHALYKKADRLSQTEDKGL